MRPFIKAIFCCLLLFLLIQIYACTKQANPSVTKNSTASRPITLQSDSDSTYVAHVAVDSSRHDSLRTFVFYCFITTAHSSTRITVPGNFVLSGTIFEWSPIQQTGNITIYTGQNYGSMTFSTSTSDNFNYTNLSTSPSTYGGQPITISHYYGVFTP